MPNTVTLTESEKEFWLQTQIRFHIDLMINFNNYYRENSDGNRDKKILSTYMEVALIKGRLFLEIMGLKYDNRSQTLRVMNHEEKRPTDISAKELGRSFIDLATLEDEKQQLLKRVFHFANKYVAHLTKPEYYYTDTKTLIKAFDLIMDLINTYLYDGTGNGRWVQDENQTWSRYSPYSVRTFIN